MLSFVLPDEADTIAFARKLACLAKKGDVFALFGTLGMGKSVLARAFIQELTGAKEVPSPTFTLVQTYEAKYFDIWHFDLYRLKTPEEIFELGMEEAIYDGVALIEWPEKMGGYLPRYACKINISNHEQGRLLTIETSSADALERFKSLRG